MTSPTRQLTYSKQDYEDAQAAWAAGHFSAEWTYWKRLAAREAGILWPPSGTEHDSWEDASPSQRAVLVRAIRETPNLLEKAIRAEGPPTWSRVVGRLFSARDAMRDRLDESDGREAALRSLEPSPRQATRSIKDILTVIGDS